MKKITSIILIAAFLLNSVLMDLTWAVEGAGLAAVRPSENIRASAAVERAFRTNTVGANDHSPFVLATPAGDLGFAGSPVSRFAGSEIGRTSAGVMKTNDRTLRRSSEEVDGEPKEKRNPRGLEKLFRTTRRRFMGNSIFLVARLAGLGSRELNLLRVIEDAKDITYPYKVGMNDFIFGHTYETVRKMGSNDGIWESHFNALNAISRDCLMNSAISAHLNEMAEPKFWEVLGAVCEEVGKQAPEEIARFDPRWCKFLKNIGREDYRKEEPTVEFVHNVWIDYCVYRIREELNSRHPTMLDSIERIIRESYVVAKNTPIAVANELYHQKGSPISFREWKNRTVQHISDRLNTLRAEIIEKHVSRGWHEMSASQQYAALLIEDEEIRELESDLRELAPKRLPNPILLSRFKPTLRQSPAHEKLHTSAAARKEPPAGKIIRSSTRSARTSAAGMPAPTLPPLRWIAEKVRNEMCNILPGV